MFLPIRSKNPPESFPWVTCGLIAVNTAVYLCTSDGFEIHRRVLEQFGEKWSNLSPATLLAGMFLHANLMHLIGNMWFLYLFGFAVEGRLRAVRFAAVYFGAGICGSLLDEVLLGRLHPNVPSIGASGAIMGVVGAALYLFPFAKIEFVYAWFELLSAGMFEMPMWGVGILYVGLDVLMACLLGRHASDGIGHFCHIGGAFGGFAICTLFRPRRDSATASDAKAIFAETRDLGQLSRWDLADLHRANPEDTTVVLNWMVMCIEDNRLSDECTRAFIAALPQIVQDQPPLSVASCISMLGTVSGCVPPNVFVDVAARVDAGGNPSIALQLYDHALRDLRITVQDEEHALFRSAMIYEIKLRNPQLAEAWYEELVNRHPMSPLATQAQARLGWLKANIV